MHCGAVSEHIGVVSSITDAFQMRSKSDTRSGSLPCEFEGATVGSGVGSGAGAAVFAVGVGAMVGADVGAVMGAGVAASVGARVAASARYQVSEQVGDKSRYHTSARRSEYPNPRRMGGEATRHKR